MADPTSNDAEAAPSWQDSAIHDRPRGFPWPPVILIGIVVLASVVAVGFRSFQSESDGPKVLTDATFVSAANSACRDAFPALRPTATDREDIVGAKEIANQSRSAADGLSALAERLEALPISGADAPFAATWLSDWRTFIESGRAYATVLDTGDVRAANKVATASDPAQRRADAFARANGLTDCQLRAVFVAPPRRSRL